jgi:hypothetical protein
MRTSSNTISARATCFMQTAGLVFAVLTLLLLQICLAAMVAVVTPNFQPSQVGEGHSLVGSTAPVSHGAAPIRESRGQPATNFSHCRVASGADSAKCAALAADSFGTTLGNPGLGRWYELAQAWGPQEADVPMADYPGGHGLLMLGARLTTSWVSSTWEFANGSWSPLVTSMVPSARLHSSLAYDQVDGYVVLFGGTPVTGPSNNALHDTWIFANGTWKNVTKWSSQTPPARYFASMAYDSADGYVVLFGGTNNDASTNRTNDTWTFHAGNWTKASPASSPPARREAMMANDPPDNGVLLFGGFSTTDLNDTWVFSKGNWTQRSISAPSPRSHGGLAYSPFYRTDILIGGLGPLIPSGYTNETWAYQAGTWLLLTPAEAPLPRSVASFAFDQTTGQLILFSGVGAHYYNDTWIFGSAPVLLNPNPPRYGQIVVNGSAYATPTYVELGFGNHSINQYQFSWGHFSNWTILGNLTFQLLTNTSGQLVVFGNGTVTVNYKPFPAVGIVISPPNCGQIVVNAQSYASGSTPRLLVGSYSLSATGCGPTLTFDQWNTTGNLAVTAPRSVISTITVNGNGTLVAVYAAAVTVRVQPASFGWVTIDGTSYADRATLNLTVGNHTLVPLPQTWSGFQSWQLTGNNLRVVGNSLTVGGIGYLTARFQLLAQVGVVVNPGTCGPITVGSVSESTGAVIGLPVGASRNIGAPNCTSSGYLFYKWSSSGGVKVANASSGNTSMIVDANGTLGARYSRAFAVTFYVDPLSAGSILVNHTRVQPDGSVALLAAWGYLLEWNPSAAYGNGSGYSIDWTTSGPALVTSGLLTFGGPAGVILHVTKVGPGHGLGLGSQVLTWWEAGGIGAAFVGLAFAVLAARRSKARQLRKS